MRLCDEFSPNLRHAACAGSILSFFILDDISPWTDKALLLALSSLVFLSVLGRLKLKKTELILISIMIGYFVLAIVFAVFFAEYYGLHSITGLYELWRAHVSLILGFILSGYISLRNKDELFSGLILALKWNVAFSLFQAVSGGFLTERMLTFSQFGNDLEYRSGIVRTVGFFTNANTNAWFIALCLYFFMSQVKMHKLWSVLSLAALFSTGSRTVLFASLAIIAFQLASNNNISVFKLFRKHVLSFTLVVAAIVTLDSLNEKSSSLGYSLIPDVAVITSVEEGKIEASYFRAYALKTSVERFLESPIVGWGPGNYGTPSSFSSHSKYLLEDGFDFFIERGMTQLDMLIPLLLPETGVIGLIMWVILMIYILRELRRRGLGSPRAQVAYYWCILLIVNSFVGPGITHPLIVAMLPIIVACSIRETDFSASAVTKPVSC